jgi:hypothetical protein
VISPLPGVAAKTFSLNFIWAIGFRNYRNHDFALWPARPMRPDGGFQDHVAESKACVGIEQS